MPVLSESYDRLLKSASPGFILRAFFPWVFVIVLNVFIYEMLIPDGRSPIDWFAGLKENLQIYATLALVISIAAIAGVSDGIVDQFVSRLRSAAIRANESESDATAASQAPRAAASGAEGPNSVRLASLLAGIEQAKTAVHRSAILAIGFGLSIWLNAFELARYQPDFKASVAVIVALWILMVGSLVLADVHLRVLIELDGRIGKFPDAPSADDPPRQPARRTPGTAQGTS